MSTREEEVRKLVEKMGTPESHSAICKCPMCMKGEKIPLAERNKHMEGLKSTMVDRRNPDNPTRPLMKATEAHAIIHAGTAVNMREQTGIPYTPPPKKPDEITPRELTVQATWKNRHQEKAVSGRDASVFGALGVLLIPKDIGVVDIPKMDASAVPERFLKKYGAQLVSLDTPVELEDVEDDSLRDLFLVQYDFDPDYIEDYVMKTMGGGGLFVETHPFPHVFTPLSKDCAGALILGVDNHNGTISFAAFKIPFGYTMKVNSNVIHGDSFFTGPYAIALTETELADSVLFRQETGRRDIQRVRQTPIEEMLHLAILAEYRLAKAVNHAILINIMNHSKASEESRNFLRGVPSDVLDAVSERTSWVESIEVLDDDMPEKIEHHAFFKAPKSRLAITDTPTPRTPTPGGSTGGDE
ncbi:hypothetical protein [Legionella sp. km772]|uniref:hypothetical protein n=1 Tax=Legionella sp. km772 TaxID=2498111 RepID=UPI000F8D2F06|nr:hypothetical protein [Legionella sp. km772]RUR11370.1 hypothetical protein ELY15_07085 [Legionella sp. km772]